MDEFLHWRKNFGDLLTVIASRTAPSDKFLEVDPFELLDAFDKGGIHGMEGCMNTKISNAIASQHQAV